MPVRSLQTGQSRPKNAWLIHNPAAGRGGHATAVAELVAFWRRQGWQLRVEGTTGPGHATTLARAAAAAGVTLVLAVGGDGTMGEVAAGLAHSETVMAPIPGGTANSFTAELGLPQPTGLRGKPSLQAANALAAGRVQRMDLGRCDSGRHWLLWSGMGIDSFLVAAIEPRSLRMRRLGRIGYAALCLWSARHYPGERARVCVDERAVEDAFLMVTICNSRRYAGFLDFNDRAQLDDGQFEVWLFRGGGGWRGLRDAFRYAWKWQVGQLRHDDERVTVLRGRRVTVDALGQAMPYHTDGDPMGQAPLRVTVDPGALYLLVPATAPDDLFLAPGFRLEAWLGGQMPEQSLAARVAATAVAAG